MVRQRDAARADADAMGAARDMAHQHRSRGTRNACHVVVFGQPIAGEAERLDMLCRAQGNRNRIGYGTALTNSDQIKH